MVKSTDLTVNFLIFAGFCLVAAYAAKKFTEDVSGRVMNLLPRVQSFAQDAARTTANTVVDSVRQRVQQVEDQQEKVVDLIEQQSPQDLVERPVSAAASDTSRDLSENERKALLALDRPDVSRRVIARISRDAGLPQNVTGLALASLENKGLVHQVDSTKTGNQYYQLTSAGRVRLAGMQSSQTAP